MSTTVLLGHDITVIEVGVRHQTTWINCCAVVQRYIGARVDSILHVIDILLRRTCPQSVGGFVLASQLC